MNFAQQNTENGRQSIYMLEFLYQLESKNEIQKLHDFVYHILFIGLQTFIIVSSLFNNELTTLQ